ncbi:thioesterase family protein [Thalassotalea sp. Y01]|uniref:acyl-CoA thioesterase n=1 Tax=Thalassotalea sp. Y01 TaxID=2729613 RepID=UPI00145F48A4|nr:thioesterase family protein [Thalassotalea sp. Y01]NMP15664.1 acyl-CoA thioesterase [Thalassotalea sp. Y01]
MFHYSVAPGFSDTDALGHINNAKLPVWFENARTPIFKLFTPSLDITKWPLILAKIEVNFLAQIYYGQNIEVRTSIEKIGNASFTVYHELYQNQKKCADGRAIMVNFNYQSQTSEPIADDIREKLQQHLTTVG